MRYPVRLVRAGPVEELTMGPGERLVAAHLRGALRRMWARTWQPEPTEVPGRLPPGDPVAPTGREQWLRQLDRTRDALERLRTTLEQGWTSGAWFTVADPGGGTRRVSPGEALALRDPRRSVVGSCLIGALVRRAADPDDPTTVADVGRCVDELYEAMHEQRGHGSFPPGRCRPPAERREHVRRLTAWNDDPGRTRDEVLELVDWAVARTIVAACS